MSRGTSWGENGQLPEDVECIITANPILQTHISTFLPYPSISSTSYPEFLPQMTGEKSTSFAWEFILFRRFEPARVKFNWADTERPDGRFSLTASAFNHPSKLPAVLVAGPTATQNSPFSSQSVARRNYRQCSLRLPTELTWVDGYIVRLFTCPMAVTHHTANRAQRTATSNPTVYQDADQIVVQC